MTEFTSDFVLLTHEKQRFSTQLLVPLPYSLQLTFKLGGGGGAGDSQLKNTILHTYNGQN